MDATGSALGSVAAGLTAALARQQATRAAQQAETRAEALQAASARERKVAERANARAETLELQAAQAGNEANRVRGNNAAARGYQRLSDQRAAERVAPGGAASDDAPVAETSATPVGSQLRAAVASYADTGSDPVAVGSGLSASA